MLTTAQKLVKHNRSQVFTHYKVYVKRCVVTQKQQKHGNCSKMAYNAITHRLCTLVNCVRADNCINISRRYFVRTIELRELKFLSLVLRYGQRIGAVNNRCGVCGCF